MMSFAEVEEIIGDTLAASAYKHQAWWSNETVGAHNWAHLWQAASWRQISVSFERLVVSFRREGATAHSTLASLAPRPKETIYDLLDEVGVSTEKWHWKENGEAAGAIKANGRYCYNWSFGSDAAVKLEGYDHFPWEELSRAIARLNAPIGLALASRWEDDGRGIGTETVQVMLSEGVKNG